MATKKTLERKVHELGALYDVSKALASSLDLGEQLHHVMGLQHPALAVGPGADSAPAIVVMPRLERIEIELRIEIDWSPER